MRHRRGSRCAPAAIGALFIVAICLWCSTSTAEAFIYWGNSDSYAIGRANLDGSEAHDAFLSFGDQIPCSVAVSGRYIYWSDSNNFTGASIARSNVDGSGKPDYNFITGASSPCGLAVYDGYLYWANGGIYGSIGRASLSGPTAVQENFVPSERASGGSDLYQSCGVAVDGSGIYWSDNLGSRIGHANLDGSGERTLISNAGSSCGVALGGGYLYWTNGSVADNTIGRALESGSAADKNFITGLNGPCGAAVYSHYLYFADGSTIDRSDLSSANPTASTQQIVFGNRNACGLAIDGLYQGQLTVYRRRSLKRGRVTLTLGVSNPGQIKVLQAGGRAALIKTSRTRAIHDGKLSITLRPTAVALKRLRSHKALRARIKISYAPLGGVTTTTLTSIELARR